VVMTPVRAAPLRAPTVNPKPDTHPRMPGTSSPALGG
jgi:hypothetical protein